MGVICCVTHRQPPHDFNKQTVISNASPCSETFQCPGTQLGSSSSGVRFFSLTPIRKAAVIACEGDEANGEPCGEKWLGKDATSAEELAFYELAVKLRKKRRWCICNFLVDYHGILLKFHCLVHGNKATHQFDLLVFRSPMEGLALPRFLSLEIGPWAPVLQCKKETEVDLAMFIRTDGVHIEGFLNPPDWIPTENATHDCRGWAWGDVDQRRAKRVPLQSLSLGESLAAVIDMREAITQERRWFWESRGPRFVDTFPQQFLGPAEYSELVLLTIVGELSKLLRACGGVPVPQKWISSSIGFFADVGAAPPRRQCGLSPEDWVRARVRLKLYGWNRSRLRPLGNKKQWMFASEEQDTLWASYQNYLFWALWESSRLYFHTFGAQAWQTLCIKVYHKSSSGDDICIGAATMALPDENCLRKRGAVKQLKKLPLANAAISQQLCNSSGLLSQISVSIAYAECPSPSRLHGVLHVCVDSAANLPIPLEDASEVFAVVILQEPVDSRTARQRTKIVFNSLDPVWREEFQFPVVSSRSGSLVRLHEAIGCNAAPKVGGGLGSLLPPPTVHELVEQDEATRRSAAAGQVAFLTEVKACWAEVFSDPAESAEEDEPLLTNGADLNRACHDQPEFALAT